MTPRLKPIRCSEESWQELLVAMNKTSAIVRLPNATLVDVLDCHAHYGGVDPEGLVIRVGQNDTKLHRKRLFTFVGEHGEICGKG